MEWKSSLIKFIVNLMHPLRLLQPKENLFQKINWAQLTSIKGIKNISKGREELIVIEYGQPLQGQEDYRIKRTNAKLYAVDNDFLAY